MYKNVADQLLIVFALDLVTNTPKTGDALNITCKLSKDGAAAASTDDTNPTEIDAGDMPGFYAFTLLKAESDADVLAGYPSSTTANVWIEPVVIYTKPTVAQIVAAITGSIALSAAGVDAIWDELASGHVAAGTLGAFLRDVWDRFIGGRHELDLVTGQHDFYRSDDVTVLMSREWTEFINGADHAAQKWDEPA